MESKKVGELARELEEKMVERGQSLNIASQYHYIFSVFIAYSEKYASGKFSRDVLEKCLTEHYGVIDGDSLTSREKSYKKAAIRAFKLICERHFGSPITNRFAKDKPMLKSESFNNVANAFYEQHISHGYHEATSRCYYRCSKQFLDYAESKGFCDFSEINLALLDEFVLTQTQYRKATIKSNLSTLRIFLRYLYREGYITENLDQILIVPRVRDQLRIPSVWQKEDVLKLLSVIDRRNPSGKCDYAMILLVTRLGIRIGDLSQLKFENIDWRNNKIDFTQSKTNHKISLPLLRDVGWALIDYIQNGRPKLDTPYLFLTHVAPIKPLSSENHHHKMIEKHMQWAHIPILGKRKIGMHSLRHTLATVMLENHEDYHNIMAALGHRSEDSASVYLKTSVELLRDCALVPLEVAR